MKKLNQSGFHLWVVPLLIVIVGFIAFAGIKVMKGGGPKNDKPDLQGANSTSFKDQYKGQCKERDVNFRFQEHS